MTISQNKTVSAVILSYNYEKYIARRIDSVINQTYPIQELIILDDHSTDNSVRIIEQKIAKIKKTHPKLNIKFIQNKVNSGKSILQWQKAFELATGDYIWLCEADDSSRRNFLEVAMQGFNNSGVILSCTNSIAINQCNIPLSLNFNRHTNRFRTSHWQQNYINNGEDEIKNYLAVNCSVPNVSAVVFRNNQNIPYAKLLDKSAKFKQVGDWYFYLNLLTYGNIAYNKDPLNFFRIHRKSVTAYSKKSATHFNEIKQIHQYLTDTYNLSNVVKQAMLREQQRVARRYGIIEDK